MDQARAISEDVGPSKCASETALLNGHNAFFGFLMKRLHNRADAEDVLQEFCLRVLARRDQLRAADRLDAWLYAILRSALNDHYRKAGRRDRLGQAYATGNAEPDTTPDATEAMSHICACIDGLIPQLKPADSDLIRRIDIEESDRAQVARDLGITPGALAVRLHRARAVLRDRLLGHCGCCCEHGFTDCSCPPPVSEISDQAGIDRNLSRLT